MVVEMEFKEKEQEFLRELTALSRKHGILVTGCGCCSSPDLKEVTGPMAQEAGYGQDEACYFSWKSPGDYDWEEYKSTVCR
jgi:hypothetical protein